MRHANESRVRHSDHSFERRADEGIHPCAPATRRCFRAFAASRRVVPEVRCPRVDLFPRYHVPAAALPVSEVKFEQRWRYRNPATVSDLLGEHRAAHERAAINGCALQDLLRNVMSQLPRGALSLTCSHWNLAATVADALDAVRACVPDEINEHTDAPKPEELSAAVPPVRLG